MRSREATVARKRTDIVKLQLSYRRPCGATSVRPPRIKSDRSMRRFCIDWMSQFLQQTSRNCLFISGLACGSY
jgi:hypothetical protein